MTEKNTLFEETFISPFGKQTETQALDVLDQIRREHPAEKGWREILGYVEKREDGLWYAVRKHMKLG